MDKQYKKNIDELNNIMRSLENDDFDLDTAKRKVDKGLTKIQNCLDLLEEPTGDIKIVTVNGGKFTFENFDK